MHFLKASQPPYSLNIRAGPGGNRMGRMDHPGRTGGTGQMTKFRFGAGKGGYLGVLEVGQLDDQKS